MDRKVWVLYVTFARDLDWLRYSLESFCKYGSGFAGVMVVVPVHDRKLFVQFERYSKPGCPVVIKDFMEYPSKGFVHHLAMKCYADVLCPEATHVLHMDPDCMFHAPFSPDDYFVDGKPVLVIEPYKVLETIHPARFNWKSVTEAALKFECQYETMCRHPAVHIRDTYSDTRKWIEMNHGTPFLDFVLKQKNKYPQGFGEFNTLGAYAWDALNDKYFWVDRGDKGESADPPSKVTQMWSYTGAAKNIATINKILGCS